MTEIRYSRFIVGFTILFLLIGLFLPRYAKSQTITEFSTGMTNYSRPAGITAGPDGNLWFTENFGNKIGKITPSGVITEFSTGISPSSEPDGITTGPDGNIWFTEKGGKRIGRITPSGVITEFSTGISPSNEPNGISQGHGITTGPDGNLWFTVQGGNRIGRITPSGVITEFSTGISPGSCPTGITTGPDGNLWFTEFFGNKIGRITPSGVITEFSTGISTDSWPAGITTGPDGNLWFTEFLGTRIGKLADITSVCIATIDGNLLLHIPFLSYVNPMSGTLSLWADFVYKSNPTYPTLIPFKLTTYGIINNPLFPCVPSTLSADLKIHIPDVLLPDGTTHLWVDLKYDPALSTGGNIYFLVTNSGVVPN